MRKSRSWPHSFPGTSDSAARERGMRTVVTRWGGCLAWRLGHSRRSIIKCWMNQHANKEPSATKRKKIFFPKRTGQVLSTLVKIKRMGRISGWRKVGQRAGGSMCKGKYNICLGSSGKGLSQITKTFYSYAKESGVNSQKKKKKKAE